MAKEKQQINKDLAEEIAKEIYAIFTERNVPFVIDGPLTVTVKLEDDTYRKRVAQGGWEFFPEYFYVGMKGDPIFGFSTLDNNSLEARDQWKYAEFTPKEMDIAFPMMLSELGKHMQVQSSFAGTIHHIYNSRTVKQKMDEEESVEQMKALPTFGLF